MGRTEGRRICTKVIADKINKIRALQGLKDGEVRNVIMGAHIEDGFDAWQMLNKRFEPGVAVQEGMAMA
jgi:hypothetical protein